MTYIPGTGRYRSLLPFPNGFVFPVAATPWKLNSNYLDRQRPAVKER